MVHSTLNWIQKPGFKNWLLGVTIIFFLGFFGWFKPYNRRSHLRPPPSLQEHITWLIISESLGFFLAGALCSYSYQSISKHGLELREGWFWLANKVTRIPVENIRNVEFKQSMRTLSLKVYHKTGTREIGIGLSKKKLEEIKQAIEFHMEGET